MAPTPSHRLKLDRAAEHLDHLQAFVAEVGKRRPYPMVETFDSQHKLWLYRLNIDEVEPPEMFPIVLGDFLFNVRSALDHLVVAIAPKKYESQVAFPIFTTDPLATNETTGEYLDAQASGAWLNKTRGLPPDCVATLRFLQPHATAQYFQKPPEHQALALLNALQNADKHRKLIGVVTGLRRVQVDAGGQAYGLTSAFNNYALMRTSPTKVNVKIEGSATIGVGKSKGVIDFDQLCEKILLFVRRDVLPRLEPFLPGGPRHQAPPPTG